LSVSSVAAACRGKGRVAIRASPIRKTTVVQLRRVLDRGSRTGHKTYRQLLGS
jgi:hypothetical protein